MSHRHPSSIIGTANCGSNYPWFGLCLIITLLLAACPSFTKTDVSIEAEMPLEPGEAIVLFPGYRPSKDSASWKFVRCLGTELAEREALNLTIMDTADFQDAMFPWFEFEHAPRTAHDMDSLLTRPSVRERIANLKVRYLISVALTTDADGFPGMFCGAGYGGAGCLGLAWESKTSQVNAIVWDLKTGREAGNLSASSSGETVALGVVIPLAFVANTEKDACKALADGLGEFLGGSHPMEP